MSPYAYSVGLYHKPSPSPLPYHERFIKYPETAQACVKQWTAEFCPSTSDVRTVPLFKFTDMQPVYMIQPYNSNGWFETTESAYNQTSPGLRRILWQLKS